MISIVFKINHWNEINLHAIYYTALIFKIWALSCMSKFYRSKMSVDIHVIFCYNYPYEKKDKQQNSSRGPRSLHSSHLGVWNYHLCNFFMPIFSANLYFELVILLNTQWCFVFLFFCFFGWSAVDIHFDWIYQIFTYTQIILIIL
jgi:sensor histidine kinase YesM